jgi:hypothetical protein
VKMERIGFVSKEAIVHRHRAARIRSLLPILRFCHMQNKLEWLDLGEIQAYITDQ